jgi:serine kinase of HPr protein (carbohydrate metabolism regulator)
MMSVSTIHATCILCRGAGVLLAGRSGRGKSDLALRLIDRGARLVSDDYTLLAVQGGRLVGTAPPAIAGRMEVRGVGILPFATVESAIIALFVDLDIEPERLPHPQTVTLADVTVPMIALGGLEPSAPIKIELALQHLGRSSD